MTQIKGGLYVCVQSFHDHNDYGQFQPTRPIFIVKGTVMFFDKEPDKKQWRGLSLATCSDHVEAWLEKHYCEHKVGDGWGPPFPNCEICRGAITPWNAEESKRLDTP